MRVTLDEMNGKSGDAPAGDLCETWADVIGRLDRFRAPQVTIDSEGDVKKEAWVFRGLKRTCYELKPTIEREASFKSMGWAALERLVVNEFKARARMHLSMIFVPDDELSWLALMRHHGVPTRLLDFTYSPYVALYFALHDSDSGSNARMYAIDAEAVNRQFIEVASSARREERRRIGESIGGRVGTTIEDQRNERDSITTDIDGLRALVAESLPYPAGRRRILLQRGCVCATSPPAFNQRLANQQGVFLLNCVDDLSFHESLIKMMEGCDGWHETLDISAAAIPEIERRLFQMNIHQQALFPDLEGLAGFIQQKIRLHWK